MRAESAAEIPLLSMYMFAQGTLIHNPVPVHKYQILLNSIFV